MLALDSLTAAISLAALAFSEQRARMVGKSMSREDFDRAVKDMGHEWIDD